LTSVAIETKESIIGIIKVMLNGNPDDVAITMERLGAGLLHRFEQMGNLCDLEEALSYRERAVQLTDEGHANKSGYLCNLSSTRDSIRAPGRLARSHECNLKHGKALSLIDDGTRLTRCVIANRQCSGRSSGKLVEHCRDSTHRVRRVPVIDE